MFLKCCSDRFVDFLCECAINIVNGNIEVKKNTLRKFEPQIRVICRKSTSNSLRRKVLHRPVGLKLLKEIEEPAANYLKELSHNVG